MAYNPSIHTASNKAYGVTGKPVDARYWYYDTGTFTYRPYANIAEVKAYLIAGDRSGATVQVGTAEYWWPDVNDLTDAGLVLKGIAEPIEQVIPSGINFTYAYDGEFGDNPTAYVQQSNMAGTGWVNTTAMITIMDDGDILAEGDFTDYSGEVYRLVVKA